MRRERGDLDVDAVGALLDRVGRDAVAEALGWPAADRVVVVAVPRAAQPAVLDRALAQRAALVRAAVVQRAEAGPAAGQRDRPAADHHAAHAPVAGYVHRIDPVPTVAAHAVAPPTSMTCSTASVSGTRPGVTRAVR